METLSPNEDRKRRYRTNPNFKVAILTRNRIRVAVSKCLAEKSDKTINLLGCSASHYVSHIESTWEEGMTWDNHGIHEQNGPKRWQIDHIIPVSSFNLLTKSGQRKAFHWSNTQAMWAVDNIRKGNKII